MNNIKRWNIAGAIFTIIVGTLLHFVYEWFGSIAAVLGAVNESTWEHLKLIFWPVVLFAIIEFIAYGRKTDGFIPIKVLSVIIGMVTVVVLFYTYTGVLGYNFLAADISTFILGTIAAYLFSYYMLKDKKDKFKSKGLLVVFIVILILLIVFFIVFTYNPPQIAMFLDPVSKTYGIN